MKSELQFLMDLFLDDTVPIPLKKRLAERMRDVEKHLGRTPEPIGPRPLNRKSEPNGHTIAQAPSMQKVMEAHPDVPVVVPATPAAAEALRRREQLLHSGMSEKPEPGRTSPRKF